MSNGNPMMMGDMPQIHPSVNVFSRFLKGEVSREDAVNAFIDYVTTGVRGIPTPNAELAKSVLSAPESSANFMGYPQMIQCMAVVIKQS